jgi:hypothetical protein
MILKNILAEKFREKVGVFVGFQGFVKIGPYH